MKTLVTSPAASGTNDPFLSLLPVGVGSLVATLRSGGFTTKAANLAGLSPRGVRAILMRERPDLLGISVMTHNRHEAMSLANLAKELNPSCFVVCGGPHATHRYREMLAISPDLDAIVLGEGEETLLEMVTLLQKSRDIHLDSIRGLALRSSSGIIVTPLRPPVADLDALPPAWSGFEGGINIDIRSQLEFLITSRGCPAACTFCNSPLFWGKNLRFRSPRSMVDEIRAIRDRYGLIYFAIRDDTFTADRRRVIEFCRLLIEERLVILWNCQSRVTAVDEQMLLIMRKAGCDCIQYGIESGSPKILKALGKRITPEQILSAAHMTRRVGIRLSIYLITGVPGETDYELRETLRLLDSIRADDGQVSPLAYYPGTRLYDSAVSQGEIPADLFERSSEEALYARNDSFGVSATKRLLQKIEATAETSAPDRNIFGEIQQYTGYNYAGTIARGEYLEEQGDTGGAEQAYREIIRQEPQNPWGWLLLGELRRDVGRVKEAIEAFTTLAELVPTHLPAWETLVELYRITGDQVALRRCRERATELAKTS